MTASTVGGGQVHINNEAEVAFNAGLDRAGAAESGVFVWSHGLLRLVARTVSPNCIRQCVGKFRAFEIFRALRIENPRYSRLETCAAKRWLERTSA